MKDFIPFPFTADYEWKILDRIIEDRKYIKCLEIGAGGSTIYFPKTHPQVEWIAIEHDPVWRDAIDKYGIPINVALIYSATLPKFDNKKSITDFIFVDGVDRVKTIEACKDLLAPGGILVLHDAGRTRYEEANKFFKNHMDLTKGVGWNEEEKTYDFRGMRAYSNEDISWLKPYVDDTQY